MGTVTAMIHVGRTHQNHLGILPADWLYLHENSRPSWHLQPLSIMGRNRQHIDITWVPTLKHMLDDAMLMIAIFILKDEAIIKKAKQCFKKDDLSFIELNRDINKQDLYQLRRKCRALRNRYKIVVTLLGKSSLSRHCPVLEKYKMDVEVCIPAFDRHFSHWEKKTVTSGSLDIQRTEAP